MHSAKACSQRRAANPLHQARSHMRLRHQHRRIRPVPLQKGYDLSLTAIYCMETLSCIEKAL